MIKNTKGFTLVELMVVLLIIGILIAVAVPVFLGARTRAQNNAANQTMTNAARVVAGEAVADSSSSPPTYTVVKAAEGSYTWLETASTGPNVVQYTEATGTISVKSEKDATTFATATVTGDGVITRTPIP